MKTLLVLVASMVVSSNAFAHKGDEVLKKELPKANALKTMPVALVPSDSCEISPSIEYGEGGVVCIAGKYPDDLFLDIGVKTAPHSTYLVNVSVTGAGGFQMDNVLDSFQIAGGNEAGTYRQNSIFVSGLWTAGLYQAFIEVRDMETNKVICKNHADITYTPKSE